MPRRALAAATILVIAATASACAPQAAPLPSGVETAVFQPRTEIASGRLAIRVTNGSDVPVTVTRAEFDSPDYSEPIVWEKHDARLGPGIAIDLRVDPVRPSCPETEPTEPATVLLDFRLEDGSTGQARLEPDDPWDHFPKLPESLCLGLLLDDAATVETARIESDGEPRHPGELVLQVTPSGGDAEVVLDAVRSTILVSILDEAGQPVQLVTLDRTLSGGDEPEELRFPIAPGRCDPHAIAEDKVGTLFPIDVTAGSRSGTIRLPATDEFRGQVYAFVQQYCA